MAAMTALPRHSSSQCLLNRFGGCRELAKLLCQNSCSNELGHQPACRSSGCTQSQALDTVQVFSVPPMESDCKHPHLLAAFSFPRAYFPRVCHNHRSDGASQWVSRSKGICISCMATLLPQRVPLQALRGLQQCTKCCWRPCLSNMRKFLGISLHVCNTSTVRYRDKHLSVSPT